MGRRLSPLAAIPWLSRPSPRCHAGHHGPSRRKRWDLRSSTRRQRKTQDSLGIFELNSMSSVEKPSNGRSNGHAPTNAAAADAAQAPQAQQGQTEQNPCDARSEADLLWKLRKYLVLLAILAAAITFQAGLGPPGGFWQQGQHGYHAGDVVLRYSYPRRYLVFFYCNTTAFGASLIVLILLLVKELSRKAIWLRSLQFAMVLGLLGLMGAYAAGSCREVRTSVYIWALLVGIFAYITLHVVFFRHLAPQWLCEIFYTIRKQWKEILGSIHGDGGTDKTGTPGQTGETGDSDEMKRLEQNRSFLLVLATLAATVTYTAGLNPPGGFWPDDNKPSHLAGDPVLRNHYPRRFKAFLVCNATAFAGSLVIIIMLLSNTAVDHVVKSNALRLCVLVSLFGLMGAYAAGSCREVHTSIYVFALVGAVFLYLCIQWIEHIVPKPDCIKKSIEWVGTKKTHLLQKLGSFIMRGANHTDETRSTPRAQNPENNRRSNTSDTAKDDVQRLRTYLLLLGILAATVTYQAGLNPPGGFWQDNDGHTAGDPILEAINPNRYKAFFYCNATAFVASLVIIILLQSQLITVGAMKRHILQTAMALDLFGLMGAYAAGSSRKFSTSVYVFILALVVFTYFTLHVLLSMALKTQLKTKLEYVPELFHRFTRDCFRRTEGGSDDGRNNLVEQQNEEKDLEKRRKFLMMLAILAASITYQSGLSPPGGFWSDNNGHRAGDPVLHDEFRRRYRIFFYFNATAFMASLAVIMLLVNKRLCHKGLKSCALRACVLVDLISLMGAFAAGSCRRVLTSIYVILVVAAVFVYVMIQILVLQFAEQKVNFLNKRRSGFESQQRSMTPTGPTGSTDKKRTEHKWRKDLMLIGTLAVTVTYQAGLLPPGGLWPSDLDNHYAGDPILKVTHPIRYKVFFYCNATAFMASTVMVILLLNNTISKYKRSLLAMKTAMVLDLLGLLGAYAAGSCRKFKTSAYIFALVIAVFIYIVIHVLLSFDDVALLVKEKGKKWMPCLKMWDQIETGASDQPSATQSGDPPV
uniref:PGG domain-containing protein n=1 Tax=Oryza punctata TaxID=4537 RepID=A0A0E0LAN2_ORYPU